MEGPSGIAVFQRAGWSMGVQDRYLLNSGEDHFTGRFASLLNPLDESFASLPPHFLDNEVPFPPNHSWDTALPGHATLPASFHPVLPVLLASLVYHSQWLRQTLPNNHSFFKCMVVTSGLLEAFVQARVVEAGEFKNTRTGLCASGVPPSYASRWR